MNRRNVVSTDSTSYPEVTVVVANFNNEKYLERCLRSLLSQETSIPYEILLIDDASTDNSLEVAHRFKGAVNIVKNDINQGLPASLNKAISESSGRFIVRVDADDYVSRHFVQTLSLPLILNENLDAVACDYYDYRRSQGSITMTVVNSSDHPIACGIIFRREQLFEIGLYDPEFRFNEDKELMRRFLKKYSVIRLPIPLYRYRQHDESMSHDSRIREVYDRKLEATIIQPESSKD